MHALGIEQREISIREAALQHFADIGHDPAIHDITYENTQARERTQILMDIANQTNGLVVGTGDLSELALGWATYNGDHMSMYGVNAGEVYFWLRAKGDSMINAGIHDGDLLLIRQQNDIDNGDIAVVAVNGDDATLKRVKKQKNAIILQPENPTCETLIFVGKEMEKISIRGRLMQLRKSF